MVATLKIDEPSHATPVIAGAVALASVPMPRGALVPQRALRDALQLLAHIADRKSTLPILSHVAIRSHAKGLVLCATDLGMALTVALDASGALPSGVAIPAKQLLDMVKILPGSDVTIDRTENGITLSAERAKSRIVGLPDRDFPKIPVAPESTTFATVDAESLLAMIDATLFSVCKDETRFHLNGALIEGNGEVVRLVTTDGHRLTVASRAVSGVVQRGVIIPARGLQEIRRLLDKGTCAVGFSASHVFVRQHGAELAIKLIDAHFPPYEQVIPRGNDRIVCVSRKALLAAFARAKTLTSATRGVRITADGDGDIVIASDDPDIGDLVERVAIDNPHRPVKTGCCATYMIEALDRIDDERVTIAFSGNELDPFMIRPSGDVALGDSEFTAVIMPMRI